MMAQQVRVGIIGGGLMGREAAAAFGRWMALLDVPVVPRLVAVCDIDTERRAWFDRIDTVEMTTDDHRRLLEAGVDVVYVAVPHVLHGAIYRDVLEAGIDLFGEKPFGIDLPAAQSIVAAVEDAHAFSRCSSELPFFPGAQMAMAEVASGRLGQIIEARATLLHSSDMNRDKPINWKRKVATCGEIGVMGDLGMHVAHVPLRLGWVPSSVYATLQDIVTHRPGPDGEPVLCDTIDNASLVCTIDSADGSFPLHLETKRIAPGHSNTWAFEVLGMEGGVSFSTRSPQILRRFRIDPAGRQVWEEVQPGHVSVFATITGSIFEFGFPDALLQMWAAFFTERAGRLGDRFGCATPEEALTGHRIFAAALTSAAEGRAVPLPAV
ncbi:MAG TPA: Gfo/Idh/MocA family oxidoreductase [Actinobacteria bacterium]|nr:Gfo/Idh/MocA family oxidoreductase [Actinomycetota bacterium]